MGLFTSNKANYANELKNVSDWEQLWNSQQRFAIFKHSTRCPISSMALNQFSEDGGFDQPTTVFYLDLIAHRDVSNKIAEDTGVQHQSPQLIVIHDKGIIDHASHSSIDASMVK